VWSKPNQYLKTVNLLFNPLEFNENPLNSERSKDIVDVDRPFFIKKFTNISSKPKRRIVRPGLVNIKSPMNRYPLRK